MQNENMYPMKTFDESVLTEITFDESKRGKIEFLMDMIYGRTDMYGYLEMGYYNERSGFAWIDLNSDGEKELLVSPYSWDNVLDMPAMYLEDDEGNYKYKELIDGYIPEKSQLIASYNSAYESLTVFEFDGENLKEVLDIDSGEKYDYYNDEYIVRYHIKDNGNYVEITETEFYNIFNSYKNQAQEIRGELLTMDNIEKVFGVRVCGAGSIMYDTN